MSADSNFMFQLWMPQNEARNWGNKVAFKILASTIRKERQLDLFISNSRTARNKETVILIKYFSAKP